MHATHLLISYAMSSDYIIFFFRLCVFQSIYNHIFLTLNFPLDDVICSRFNIPHGEERASCYFVRRRGERDREKERWGEGKKSVARLASRRPRSMTSPFPRRLVARFTRPSISHFCRTQDTHLSCKHLSPPFPLPSRRRPISDPSSPSLSLRRRSRDVVRPDARTLNGASSRHTCVPHPPDTCSVAVEHDEPHGYAYRPRRRPYFLSVLSLISNT